jgi:rhodanese-related sulfurtransferase
MNKATFKSSLFSEFARIGKALASPHRLQLIDVLAQGERTVEELSEELGSAIANVSQHLQVLRGAQLVSVRRSGTFSYYSLADEQVFTVWRSIRDLGASRFAEVNRLVSDYFGRRDELEVVSVGELRRRLEDPATVVLDVRPRREYEAGHIRGAQSVPIRELKKRLKDIPRSSNVVAYCRGPYCVFAAEAVAALRAAGYRAARLESGFPDWKARGHPAEVGVPS